MVGSGEAGVVLVASGTHVARGERLHSDMVGRACHCPLFLGSSGRIKENVDAAHRLSWHVWEHIVSLHVPHDYGLTSKGVSGCHLRPRALPRACSQSIRAQAMSSPARLHALLARTGAAAPLAHMHASLQDMVRAGRGAPQQQRLHRSTCDAAQRAAR